mmetsp:Transcript_12987/g.19570  ORF Transcript_12987/g.19570 Transcript_12987/m.19570 type:complete len:1468 (+) Transcript_12987:23-4426(+)
MRRLFKIGSDRHDIGRVTFSWHPEGNFIASAGSNGIIQITDRNGGIVDEIPMTSSAAILNLQWDKDGDYLAVLQDGNSIVPLWSLNSRRVIPLETNLVDPTFLAWSKTGPQLAIGTAKGNLLIYNKQQKKKVPVVGKHAKRIVCGGWSSGGNKIVLGSDDRTITVSNEAGDTLIHTELKYPPYEASFSNRQGYHARQANKDSVDDTVSANLGGKSLLLLNILDENEDPMELTFATTSHNGPCRYGDLLHYEWFNDNMLIIGFSGGWIIVVSTEMSEIGEEKYATQVHASKLSTFSYNPHLKRLATAGTDGVRVLDTKDFKEIKNDYVSPDDLEHGKVTQLQWSPDGQILSIATSSGNIYNFLAKMSILYATYRSTVCYLSSLREVSIVNAKRRTRPMEVTLMLEPTVIAVGSKHVAGGMNHKVYYHRITPSGSSGGPPSNDIVNEQEYVSTVRCVQMNSSFSAVLTDGRVVLHPIEAVNPQQQQQQTKTFPTREEGAFSKVTCIALTEDFLYYGTEAGAVEVFFLGEWMLLAGAELRLDNTIKALYPNGTGTRVVVVDSANQVFLFNPVTGGGVNQSITRFEATPSVFSHIMWDIEERNVIMIFEGKYVHTYVYTASSIKGPMLAKLGPVEISSEGGVALYPDRAELPQGHVPLMSVMGVLTCQTLAGNLATVPHPYFDQLDDGKEGHTKVGSRTFIPAVMKSRFCQSLALLKLEDAWQAALELNKREYWLALSGKAMELMNVELAVRVYRQLGDAGMVMSLQKCMHVEDKHLLGGHIALLFSDYHRAQELFLLSSKPVAALDMQSDLMRWDQALKLAHNLAPDRVPLVSIKYGQQLEFREESERALRLFESAINAVDNEGMGMCPEHLTPVAMAGIARCNLRLGNIRQGIRLAADVNTKVLYSECGDILEHHKQYMEAASMFMKADNLEKTAEIYVRHLLPQDKNKINEAVPIFEKVTNSQLNSSFAKACVAAGRYQEAARAYERAKDIDKVVEINLRHLDDVQQAFDLVRETASSEGATLVADYCLEVQNYRGAIEFMLLAKKSDEAFKLAQSHSQVDTYASLLGDNIAGDDALRVAHYYEKSQDFGKAGRYYALCSQYQRALKLFIQCGDREIDSAIEVVGKSQNEHLTHQLIDFLVGEKDGIPKDPNYIYRLYMALRKYDDAAKTALIIARQEQDMGNYALAHSVIAETIRKLEEDNIRVPLQLRTQFVLLHSYLLVKRLVKKGDHSGAARMLLRVAESVSKFPQHLVPILTSTVVECQRAGLKASSYEYAAMLMRPEHRPNIDPNLKRKIEAIVRRRSAHTDDMQEELSPCPLSGQMIPQTQLSCPTTRDALPMCIITGRHMLIDDWCFCPNSKFPALYSEYLQFIQDECSAARAASEGKDRDDEVVPSATDPILGMPVTASMLEKVSQEEAMKYIQKYNNVKEESENKRQKNNSDGSEEMNGNANETLGSPSTTKADRMLP